MSDNIVINVRQVFDALYNELVEGMAGFAQYAEDATKSESESYWEDDSGSARASITAYEFLGGDHEKNFQSPAWATARTAGYVSPVWGNTPENFQPDVQDADFEGDHGIVLTMFVPYAEALETGENGGGLSGNAPIFREAGRRRMERRTGLLADMSQRLAQEFESHVADTIRKVIG